MKKLENFLEQCVIGISLLIFFFLSVYSLFFTTYYELNKNETPMEKMDFFPAVLLAVAAGTALLYLVGKRILRRPENRKRNIKILAAVSMIYAAVFTTAWIFIGNCIPIADAESVRNAAEQFLQGNFSELTVNSAEKYLYIYPHQLGLLTYWEGLMLLFGDGAKLAFLLFNVVWTVIFLFASYRITRLLFQRDEIVVYELLLSMGCLPLLIYSNFSYGESISIMLSMVAVWLFLLYFEHGKKRFMVLCGVCISVAILLRSNCLITLVAMLGILFVKGVVQKHIKEFLMMGMIGVLVLGSKTALYRSYEMYTGIPVNEGMPSILWIAMGMQESYKAAGWYNDYSKFVYEEVNYDEALAAEKGKYSILGSLHTFKEDPLYMVDFYKRKFVSQWNDPTYQCLVMTYARYPDRGPLGTSIYKGALFPVLVSFMNGYQSLIFVSVLGYLAARWKKRENIEKDILLIIVIGGVLFHLLWEAKGRYILPYFVIMLPPAAAGIYEITEKIKGWRTVCTKKWVRK